MNRRFSSKRNGKKGGRPASKNGICIKLKDFDLIILTKNQYENLLKKYEHTLLIKAFDILQEWLESSPNAIKYRGKNNYAYFRSDGWVINTAKREVF